jgi:hypothetical protein
MLILIVLFGVDLIERKVPFWHLKKRRAFQILSLCFH